MKILIVSNLYSPHVRGGAERFMQDLAESLAGRGTDVVVASTGGRGPATTSALNRVKVVYLPMANLYWPFDNVFARRQSQSSGILSTCTTPR